MKRYAIFVMALVALALVLPAGNVYSSRNMTSQHTPLQDSGHPCGDNICDAREQADPSLCPQDCTTPSDAAEESNQSPFPIVEADFQVHRITNPTSDAELYVEIVRPRHWDGQPLPTLVFVPGGTGSSADFKRSTPKLLQLADAGYTIVLFDPDGRGQSTGIEDLDGTIHQDGLAAVIEFAASLHEVDTDAIGLATFSYGITMGSGTLARYPDLPVRFLIDWEGPADRYDTTFECTPNPRIDWADCDDEDFWSQREALTFIAEVAVPYQRLQSAEDHVQPDVSHAINMVNAAAQGAAPWTRLNDLPPDQLYDPASPPMMTDKIDQHLMTLIREYAADMFALHR
jgi:pimeloyl-ACP methyl ester carboxylesterase